MALGLETLAPGLINNSALREVIGLIRKPRLDIEFKPEKTYDLASDPRTSPKQICLYVHLNVVNKSKTIAQGCKVFLLKLERKINNQFQEIPLHTHPILKWANESEPKGFEGLEILGNEDKRVDLVHGRHQNHNQFDLYIESGPRGVPNGFGQGEYRFTVQTSGSNTNTITKKFILKWQGTFEKENIEVIEEK